MDADTVKYIASIDREAAALREENARLKATEADLRKANLGLGKGMAEQNSKINVLTRERDEAREMRDTWHTRAEAHRQAQELAEAEVARLEGLILDCGDDAPGSAGKIHREANRIRAQREGE